MGGIFPENFPEFFKRFYPKSFFHPHTMQRGLSPLFGYRYREEGRGDTRIEYREGVYRGGWEGV